MAMHNKGLTKLTEECGELIQAASKAMAYPLDVEHPDGKGDLAVRIAEEMGDVQAAIIFTANKLGLDKNRILDQTKMKLRIFNQWDLLP